MAHTHVIKAMEGVQNDGNAPTPTIKSADNYPVSLYAGKKKKVSPNKTQKLKEHLRKPKDTAPDYSSSDTLTNAEAPQDMPQKTTKDCTVKAQTPKTQKDKKSKKSKAVPKAESLPPSESTSENSQETATEDPEDQSMRDLISDVFLTFNDSPVEAERPKPKKTKKVEEPQRQIEVNTVEKVKDDVKPKTKREDKGDKTKQSGSSNKKQDSTIDKQMFLKKDAKKRSR